MPNPERDTALRRPAPEILPELVARIVGSPEFVRSDRLRDLVKFLAHHAAQGTSNQLTEAMIAREVFGRASQFVASEDSIVRVTMRHLRLKLQEYFHGSGCEEAWVLELPKGDYALVVKPRTESDSLPATAFQRRSTGVSSPWRAVLVATLALSMAANLWLWINQQSQSLPEPSLINEFVSSSKLPTIIIVGDAALHAIQIMDKKNYTLTEYVRRDFIRHLDAKPSASQDRFGLNWMRRNSLSSSAHLSVITSIFRALGPAARVVSVRHSREVTARELEGANLVILGAHWVNPWAEPFERKLNFQFMIEPDGSSTRFVNRDPRKDEPTVYRSVQSEGASASNKSLIALIDNPSGKGSVLYLAGLERSGTEAAAKLACDPELLTLIRKAVDWPRGTTIPRAEFLIESFAVADVPMKPRVLALRQQTAESVQPDLQSHNRDE